MEPTLFDRLLFISGNYGTGNPSADFALIALGASLLALLATFIAGRRQERGPSPELERLFGLSGRVEKLDMNLNVFRTDTVRSLELARSDLQNVKVQLGEIRRMLGGGGEPTPSKPERDFFDTSDDIVTVTEESSSDDGSGEKLVIQESLPEESAPVADVAPVEAPRSLFERLSKTRSGFFGKLKGILGLGRTVDEAALDQLEEALITSDVGVKTTQELLNELRAEISGGARIESQGLINRLKEKLLSVLTKDAPVDVRINPEKRADGPLVVLIVGVNGAGKTTTVAKLAHQWKESGAKVMVAAADTFRAAAVDQLAEWARRLDVPIISGASDAKPATVVFDAMKAAQEQGVDVLLIDTAGRLHNKANLMQELEGVRNVIVRHQASAPHEVLLVVDGSTGQNALNQAREFNQVAELTGLIVTKLDGTSKGGVVTAIRAELGIPVRYIGVGEGKDDLRPFNASEFVEALLAGNSADAPELIGLAQNDDKAAA